MYQLTDTGIYGIKKQCFSDERGMSLKFPIPDSFNFETRQLLSVSNPKEGTLRGMHFQVAPKAENKIICCLSGSIFDVLVNLETLHLNNPEIFSIHLGDDSEFQGLLVPSNYAHGYLTLSEKVSLNYVMDKEFDAFLASGLRWNDPKLAIEWPSIPKTISKRDMEWPVL